MKNNFAMIPASLTCRIEVMKKAPHEIFALRLQQVRDERGWNLSDIARRAMVTPQAVQQWAKGETAARGVRLKRLAAAAGKPEHWFFTPPDGTDEDSTLPPVRELDQKEEALLNLFNQMPETEKLRLIMHAKAMLHELDLLKGDVLNIIQDLNDK